MVPQSFSDVWCAELTEHHKIENKPLNQYNDKQRKQIAAQLHDWQITPSGTLGYTKAEVTCAASTRARCRRRPWNAMSAGAVFYRRGRGCHRDNWRFQLPVGVASAMRQGRPVIGSGSGLIGYSRDASGWDQGLIEKWQDFINNIFNVYHSLFLGLLPDAMVSQSAE